MKTPKIFTILALLLPLAASANQEKHMFWCGLTDTDPEKQVYIEVPAGQENSGRAHVILSEMGQDADANEGWQVLEDVDASVDLTWGKYRGQDAITGAVVNMGRSGSISAEATEDYDKYGYAPGRVKANHMKFNFPRGRNFTYCTYFYSTGPRPGLTGSNRTDGGGSRL